MIDETRDDMKDVVRDAETMMMVISKAKYSGLSIRDDADDGDQQSKILRREQQ